MSLETKPEKRLIGYARVSTQQQDLARQTKALKYETPMLDRLKIDAALEDNVTTLPGWVCGRP